MQGLENQPDIFAFLDQHENKELLRFVAVGSVDDGKSTLIGRLLHDTGQVYEDQLQDARGQTADGEIDFALLTDGLRAEREQGITIDVAYRYFSTPRRKFIIADTPGHVQYTRNMVTGASTANAAIILIDARLGVLQQSKRHAYIASLLGIPHLIVCINKMDLVDYERARYEEIQKETIEFSKKLHFEDISFFPISALKGDNIVSKSPKTPWFEGDTLLEHLETLPVTNGLNLDEFRMPIQYVLRPHLDYRGFAGQLASGVVRKGDQIKVLPSGKTSRVKAIDTYEGEIEEAFAPMSIALRLEDEIDISRGDMLVHVKDHPIVTQRFRAMLVWMNEHALDRSHSYLIKHTTRFTRAELEAIHWKIDPNTLDSVDTETLVLNDVAEVTLTTHRPLYLDAYQTNRNTGAFIVVDTLTNNTVAAGVTLHAEVEGRTGVSGPQKQRSLVEPQERHQRWKQRGTTVWFSGLPASGKSTLAYALEARLFSEGYLAQVIDPDDVVSEIDLDVTDKNVWAVSSLGVDTRMAKHGNEAGWITLCTNPIPRLMQRETIRRLLGEECLIEVHLKTSMETCKERIHAETSGTPSAQLKRLEHLSVTHEVPQSPQLLLEETDSTEAQVDKLMQLLRERGILQQS